MNDSFKWHHHQLSDRLSVLVNSNGPFSSLRPILCEYLTLTVRRVDLYNTISSTSS